MIDLDDLFRIDMVSLDGQGAIIELDSAITHELADGNCGVFGNTMFMGMADDEFLRIAVVGHGISIAEDVLGNRFDLLWC